MEIIIKIYVMIIYQINNQDAQPVIWKPTPTHRVSMQGRKTTNKTYLIK